VEGGGRIDARRGKLGILREKVLRLSEASRDLREALIPDVEANGAGRESMSKKLTRKSEDLNDNGRQPPQMVPLKVCG
jgi:hypothetical protein